MQLLGYFAGQELLTFPCVVLDCCVCIFGFVLTLSLSSLAEDQVGGAAAGREEGREKKKKKNSRDRRRARFFFCFKKS